MRPMVETACMRRVRDAAGRCRRATHRFCGRAELRAQYTYSLSLRCVTATPTPCTTQKHDRHATDGGNSLHAMCTSCCKHFQTFQPSLIRSLLPSPALLVLQID